MDLFYSNCNIQAKRRVHFHKFMLEIHQRIHKNKQQMLELHGRDININLSSERDAIAQVASKVADECKLLCFDEFQVTDICDAMILTKLFGILWDKGTVLFATSNRPPSDLYNNGINRDYFVPFINRLQRECIVSKLGSDGGSNTDYRQQNIPIDNSYFFPLGKKSSQQLWQCFINDDESDFIVDTKQVVSRDEKVAISMGRYITVKVNTTELNPRICWVTFNQLCNEDRGASDYIALTHRFDTIYLEGIPYLSVLEHDKARRFITFIDEVYDAHINLIWTAENKPNQIFQVVSIEDERLIRLNNPNLESISTPLKNEYGKHYLSSCSTH